MPTTLRTTGVDLRGLMTVLGTHLYSTPVVAVRELVQNAHDSITRRQVEETAGTGLQPLIQVSADPAAGTVTIEDNGAGLTENEIHTYLATVGIGYTRTLRESSGDPRLIGAFGLGFLSAFVVARQVTVHTTSYTSPQLGHCYRSSDGERYTVEAVEARPVGTVVTLELAEAHRELAGPALLQRLLGRYCALLSHPIVVRGTDGADGGDPAEPVNAVQPPWRTTEAPEPPGAAGPVGAHPDEHPAHGLRRRLEFAARFEHRFEPLCPMDVQPTDGSDARGLLWIQDGATYATSDNRNLSVFVRGMLLDDDARDLLPTWAGFVGGVIESDTLTPTASREDLQRDAGYQRVRAALAESLVVGLTEVARRQPEAWRRVLTRHAEALLGAALVDRRLFDLIADEVKLPTSAGDRTPAGLRAGGRGDIHVTLGTDGGFEETLFRVLGIPVARGDRYGVLPFLRAYCEHRSIPLVELGTAEGDRRLFRPAELDDAARDWLSEQLAGAGQILVPARFAPAELPLVVVVDREAELKRRLAADEADRRISLSALRLARSHLSTVDADATARLYLNLDSPVVTGLLDAWRAGRPGTALAAGLLRSVRTILATGANAGGVSDADELNQALAGLAAVVTALTALPGAPGPAHPTAPPPAEPRPPRLASVTPLTALTPPAVTRTDGTDDSTRGQDS